MNMYDNEDNQSDQTNEPDENLNTMAVLSTLGGGDGVTPEGEPLGLDPESDKAKVSGSSLAVGVVVVLGAVALLGMKLTLGAIGAGEGPSSAMAEIDNFIATQTAADKTGATGPLKAPDEESKRVLDELNQNPYDNQVPAEEVETNPFDISKIVKKVIAPTDDNPSPTSDPRADAVYRAKRAAANFKVDSISGNIVFINGEMYRIGEEISDTGFKLESVDGLTCVIRTTDEFKIGLVLRYR